MPANIATAVINVTPNSAPSPGVCTPATFTLQSPPPAGISQPTPGGKIIVRKSLLGNPPMIQIQFDLGGTGLSPVGVTFQQQPGGTGGDPNGAANFPPGLRRVISSSVYQVTDIAHDAGAPAQWAWSIGINVNDSSGNAAGILDPDLENQF